MTTSATPTATATTSASSATTLDAQAALQAEAVEAVKAYYDAWNRAIVSRDSSELRAMSLPQCGAARHTSRTLTSSRRRTRPRAAGSSRWRASGLPGAESGIGVQGKSVRAPVQILSNKGTVVTSYAVEDGRPAGSSPAVGPAQDQVDLMTARQVAGAVALLAVAVAGCGGPRRRALLPRRAAAAADLHDIGDPNGHRDHLGGQRDDNPRPQAALQAEAVETVKEFYAAWNDALVTHDSRPLTALALPECESCALIAADIDAIAKQKPASSAGRSRWNDARRSWCRPRHPRPGRPGPSGDPAIDASGKVARSAEEDTAPGCCGSSSDATAC